MSDSQLEAHFFRREYAKIVSTLSRRMGVNHIQDIEDAVQSAMVKSLEVWKKTGTPENPAGWLFTVARHNLLGALRQEANRKRIQQADFVHENEVMSAEASASHEEQDLLCMLFVCCRDDIPVQSQLVFALKILCGFSISEIAQRLFISEANAYKRLTRARKYLQSSPPDVNTLALSMQSSRLPAVTRS